MVSVKLVDVTKTFSGGTVVAADHVNLEIRDGEFFTLLGPSGCGKTTLLRLIAGFYYPDSGKIYFDDKDVTETPPYERETGMVFQNYALWPHMTVFDNIAYGLKIRKLPKEEIKERVEEALRLVHLEGMEDRMPHQLSGGQQQRVAVARALVIHPKVLLLDEPLSNLDAKLRVEMRSELVRLQRELGITAIYVTHDQEEAMAISQRLAIIRAGKIQQVGTPKEVYEKPQNYFVADFIGQCTFFEGVIEKVQGKYITVKTKHGPVLKGIKTNPNIDFKVGDIAVCAIRPEDFHLNKPSDKVNSIVGVIQLITFLGQYNQIFLNVNGLTLQISVDTNIQLKENQQLTVYANIEETMILKPDEKIQSIEAQTVINK